MKVRGRVIMHLPAADVAERMGSRSGSVEPLGADRCLLQLGGPPAALSRLLAPSGSS
jgi:hypothetical protein